jgi:hypothetical protein
VLWLRQQPVRVALWAALIMLLIHIRSMGRMRRLSDSLGDVPGMVRITVTGLTGRNGLSTGGVTWGVAPFSVPFAYYGDQEDGHTYTIDYGDGSSEKMSFISGPACSVCGQSNYYRSNHTYIFPGTFIATIRDISGMLIGTSTVTIESATPG